MVMLLGWSAERADACACCDAKTSRKPVGWSDAGDTILFDVTASTGCEPRRMLEIWKAGADEPAGCYDLYGDPEKQIACADLSSNLDGKKKLKTSKQVKQYPKKPVQLAAGKVKVRKVPAKDEDGNEAGVKITVEIDGKQVLNEEFSEVNRFGKVTAWPNAKNDRVVLLVSYTVRGTNNEAVAVRWVELSKPKP